MKKGLQKTNTSVEDRRDDAVRRALNTPPKPLKDMNKGKAKKRQDQTTASEKRT